MTDREGMRLAFIDSAGWTDATITALPGDASFRRYFRLAGPLGKTMLMDAPPPQEDVRPFQTIAAILADLKLSAPVIPAADPEAGFLLLEDLGDSTYTRLIADGHDEAAGGAGAGEGTGRDGTTRRLVGRDSPRADVLTPAPASHGRRLGAAVARAVASKHARTSLSRVPSQAYRSLQAEAMDIVRSVADAEGRAAGALQRLSELESIIADERAKWAARLSEDAAAPTGAYAR